MCILTSRYKPLHLFYLHSRHHHRHHCSCNCRHASPVTTSYIISVRSIKPNRIESNQIKSIKSNQSYTRSVNTARDDVKVYNYLVSISIEEKKNSICSQHKTRIVCEWMYIEASLLVPRQQQHTKISHNQESTYLGQPASPAPVKKKPQVKSKKHPIKHEKNNKRKREKLTIPAEKETQKTISYTITYQAPNLKDLPMFILEQKTK